MRVRNNVVAAAIVSAAVLSWTSVAHAQGPVTGHPGGRPGAPSAIAPKAPQPVRVVEAKPQPAAVAALPAAPSAVLPGVEHVFTPPAVIGEAWARALRAVLDRMKNLVDAQKVAVESLRPRVTPGPPSAPSVPAWRAVWLPAAALREAIAASPVQVGPVSADPPTESGRDTRGEHAVLLGARMELPWMVP